MLLVFPLACAPDDDAPDAAPDAADTDVTDGTVDTNTVDTEVPTGTDTGSVATPGQSALVFDGPIPTNVLVISLDTTRRDFLGWYAGTDTTPNLDAVVAQSFVLEQHRSCSNWTAPSMTCVMSGFTPFEWGFWPWNTNPELRNRPPDTYRTVPGVLSELGTTSVLVTANPVFSDETGITEGFDRLVHQDYQPAENVTDAALTELDALQAGGTPWMLHVHYFDPHADYCSPDEWIDPDAYQEFPYDLCEEDLYGLADAFPAWPADQQAAFLNNLHERYRAEIAYWDNSFGRLWAEAGLRGALDDTLVVFVTDHGEQFFERGFLGHGNAFGPEENLSAAAFWAVNLTPGSWSGLTVHQDIAETLLRLHAPDAPATGGQLIGTAPPDRTVTGMNYWSSAQVTMLAASDNRQLTYDFWGHRALYRLDTDPAGLVDVYSPTDPDVVALWAVLQPLVDEVASTWTFLDPPVDPGP